MSDSLTRMRIALRADGVEEKRARSLLFWARSFLVYCNNDEPEQLDRTHVEAFLKHLTEERFAGKPACNRALDAIERLYDATPDGIPGWLKILLQERRSETTPNILSRDEVARLLSHLTGRDWLAAALVYGTGMRLLECVRLRVRDVNLEQNELLVRDSADRIRRRLPLPDNTQERLRQHLEELKLTHIRDIVEGNGRATLPPIISARQPNVARSWGWQYLFPQRPEPGQHPNEQSRGPIHHVDPQTLHRRFERAAMDARIYRRVTGHVLRNSFALHMIQQGVPVSQVEQILGTRQAENEEAAAGTLPRTLRIPDAAAVDRLAIN